MHNSKRQLDFPRPKTLSRTNSLCSGKTSLTPRTKQDANALVLYPSAPLRNNPPPTKKKVRRVTTELKRFQLRYPRAAAEAAAAAAGAKSAGGSGGEVDNVGGAEGSGHTGQDGLAVDDLPPWVTSSEVMSPLLTAYDARIQVGLATLSTAVVDAKAPPPPPSLQGWDGTEWDGTLRRCRTAIIIPEPSSATEYHTYIRSRTRFLLPGEMVRYGMKWYGMTGPGGPDCGAEGRHGGARRPDASAGGGERSGTATATFSLCGCHACPAAKRRMTGLGSMQNLSLQRYLSREVSEEGCIYAACATSSRNLNLVLNVGSLLSASRSPCWCRKLRAWFSLSRFLR